MFDNIGGKIKVLAQVVCWIGIILSVIVGLVSFENGGIIFMIVGALFSWVGSFALYGFGQLIENTDIIVKHFKSNSNGEETEQRCPYCDGKIIIPKDAVSPICPWCNNKL